MKTCLFFMILLVLVIFSTTGIATTYSYSISGKVTSNNVGVPSASISHYTTWSNGAQSGGGIGPTAWDGSFAPPKMTNSYESYVGRTMKLKASKSGMSGSKSWVCSSGTEYKIVKMFYNVAVNPNLRFETTPIKFAGDTTIDPSPGLAYVDTGYAGEMQIQGFTMNLAYDPQTLSPATIGPTQEYAYFNVTYPEPNIINISAGEPLNGLMLGDPENPVHLFDIEWTPLQQDQQYVTEVQTENVEFKLGPTSPGDPVQALPHTAEHLVGDATPCEPHFFVDSQIQWQEILDANWPQPYIRSVDAAEWERYMSCWDPTDPNNIIEGELYPANEFLPAKLWVYEGGGSGGTEPNDSGLVMGWGDNDTDTGNYSSAWHYDYGLDPDLRNSIIQITVTAPQFGVTGVQVNAVSFGINDAAGRRRSWWWSVGTGGTIPWNTPTTVTIDTSLTGIGATTPQASGYTNNVGFNLAQAQSFEVDENASWIFQPASIPAPGQPSFMGMWNYWHNLTVTNKTEGSAYKGSYAKYSQPPVVVDANQDPVMINGWDELSRYEQGPVMADDWLCKDERPVTDIHWWGSFIDWDQPTPPPIVPKAFHIGIWTDIPAGADTEYSHPGRLVWENYCDSWVWNFAGYDLDPRCEYPDMPCKTDETCFQFNQLLSQDQWFYQQPETPDGTQRIYWLSIAAIYDREPNYPFGWKTRPHKFQDDAVRITDTTIWPITLNSDQPVDWTGGVPIQLPEWPEQGVTWDLAFEITTNQPGPPEEQSADFNRDGIVDMIDFTHFANQWLTAGP